MSSFYQIHVCPGDLDYFSLLTHPPGMRIIGLFIQCKIYNLHKTVLGFTIISTISYAQVWECIGTEQDCIFHSLCQYYFKTCLLTNDITVWKINFMPDWLLEFTMRSLQIRRSWVPFINYAPSCLSMAIYFEFGWDLFFFF